MKPKHTPGPWKVAHGMRGLQNLKVHGVENNEGLGIVNCGTGKDGEANARLIAAAPDMLEALKLIVKMGNDSSPEGIAVINRGYEMAAAAIAKVEGRV